MPGWGTPRSQGACGIGGSIESQDCLLSNSRHMMLIGRKDFRLGRGFWHAVNNYHSVVYLFKSKVGMDHGFSFNYLFLLSADGDDHRIKKRAEPNPYNKSIKDAYWRTA